jgi:hypothetical protein
LALAERSCSKIHTQVLRSSHTQFARNGYQINLEN